MPSPCPARRAAGSQTCLYPSGSRMDPATLGGGSGRTCRVQEPGWGGKCFVPVRVFLGDPKCWMEAPVKGTPGAAPASGCRVQVERGEHWLGWDRVAAALDPLKIKTAAPGRAARPCHRPITTTMHVAFAKRCPRQAGWLLARVELFVATAPPPWLEMEGGSSRAGVRAGSPGCRHWWLWYHLPQQPSGPVGCTSITRSRGTSPAQAAPAVPGGVRGAVRGCLGITHGCFLSSKHSLRRLSSSCLPSPLGRSPLSPPPSRSPGGAGNRPSSTALCRSAARRQGRAAWSARCWLRHRGESRRPGLCRDLPDPTAAPDVPAGPRAGTPRHGTHRSCRHPAARHCQPLLSRGHPKGPCPILTSATSRDSNARSLQSTEI